MMLPAIDPVIALVLRVSLALLLLSAAWHKLRDLDAFRSAVDGYALLPSHVVPRLTVVFIVGELLCGLGLLLPVSAALAAPAAAAILALYTGAIAINLVRGRRRIDCGCAGPAGALPLSPALVVRNTTLIVLALVAALPASTRALEPVDGVVVGCAVATFSLLYVAAETSLRNAAHWREATFTGAVPHRQPST